MTKLRHGTCELLRAFKRLDAKIPGEARAYVAQAFARWKPKFGRKWLKRLIVQWAWLENLIETWRLIGE